MSFLFPLYLLGLLALAVPLYLHLKKRPPSDVVEFSSLRFLKPTRNLRVNRRARLEHLALLALRCLALLFLAGMFARPFFPDSDAGSSEPQDSVVVLVDTSASMQREGVWPAVKEEAKAVLESLEPEDRVALFSFGGGVTPLVPFPEVAIEALADGKDVVDPAALLELERLTESLESLEAGWSGTDLGLALVTAAESLDDQPAGGPGGAKMIHLISDLQASADLAALRQYAWPTDVRVQPHVIEAGSSDNASLRLLRGEGRRLRLVNDPASAKTTFEVLGQSIVLAPGGQRVIDVPEGTNWVELTGDDDAFDNTVHLAPPQPLPLGIRVLGSDQSDQPDNPKFYLKRVFAPSRYLRPVVSQWNTNSVASVATPNQLTILLETPTVEQAGRLRRELDAGAWLFFPMPRLADKVDVTAVEKALKELVGHPVRVRESSGHNFALLEDIDFVHPALVGFEDPTLRDFTKLRFWHHRELSGLPDAARVLAKFDTGGPAWIEFSSAGEGGGKLLVWASSWHPKDSPLARSSKFVPLLYGIAQQTGLRLTSQARVATGEALPALPHLPETEWTHPWDADWPGEGASLVADAPGLFTARSGAEQFVVAANVPPEESESALLSLQALEQLGVRHTGMVRAVDEAKSDPGAESDRAQESRQNVWQLLAMALMVLLIVETFLAHRTPISAEEASGEIAAE